MCVWTQTSGVAVCHAFKYRTYWEQCCPGSPDCLCLPQHILNSSITFYQKSVRHRHQNAFTTTSCGAHLSYLTVLKATKCYQAQSVQKDKILKKNPQQLYLSFTSAEDFKKADIGIKYFENSGLNNTGENRENHALNITLTTVSKFYFGNNYFKVARHIQGRTLWFSRKIFLMYFE